MILYHAHKSRHRCKKNKKKTKKMLQEETKNAISYVFYIMHISQVCLIYHAHR